MKKIKHIINWVLVTISILVFGGISFIAGLLYPIDESMTSTASPTQTTAPSDTLNKPVKYREYEADSFPRGEPVQVTEVIIPPGGSISKNLSIQLAIWNRTAEKLARIERLPFARQQDGGLNVLVHPGDTFQIFIKIQKKKSR